MKTVKVAAVEVIPMMCGKVTCKHCGHKQSAQAWEHDKGKLPLTDYAVRCNACGNPIDPPLNAGV